MPNASILVSFFWLWLKNIYITWQKQPKGENAHLAHSSRLQAVIAESWGIRNLKQLLILHPQSRAENNELAHSFCFLYFYAIFYPKNGTIHSGWALPTSMDTIKTIFYRHAHRPTLSRQSLFRLFSKVILDCVKLTIKTHHHGFQTTCLSSVMTILTPVLRYTLV